MTLSIVNCYTQYAIPYCEECVIRSDVLVQLMSSIAVANHLLLSMQASS